VLTALNGSRTSNAKNGRQLQQGKSSSGEERLEALYSHALEDWSKSLEVGIAWCGQPWQLHSTAHESFEGRAGERGGAWQWMVAPNAQRSLRSRIAIAAAASGD
jgi:hypothetical protein